MRSLIVFLVAFLSTVANLSPLQAESLLIQDIRVYSQPGAAPIENADLWLEHGRIQAVGKKISRRNADTTLSGSSMVALAGFWNSHVHFTEPHWLDAANLPAERLQKQLEKMLLRHGFTTVVDTGSAPANTRALRSRIEAGLAGPAILQFAGNFVSVGGSPAYLEVKLPELASPEQARAATEEVLGLGVEGIKIFTGSYLGPGKVAHLELPLVQAVTDAAHGWGALVLSHPQSRRGLELAIDGGVDVLTHSAPDAGIWAGPFVKRMIDANIALIPTLKLWRFELQRAGVPEEAIEAFQQRGVEQTRAFAQAGGEILFGTDVGYMTDDDPAEEFHKLTEAGLDFKDMLAALTTAPAARFGGGEIKGRVEIGEPADLVILGSDPAQDPEAWTDIRYTIRGGRLVYVAPETSTKAPAGG